MDSARKRGRPKLPFDEKKRRRSEQIASYNLRKVHIGIEIHRWNRLKLKKGLKTNAMVAEYLLNLAEREEEYKRPYGPPFTSTPFASPYIDDSKGFNAVFSGISDNDAASSVTEKEINVTSVSSLSSACGEVCDIMKKEQMSSNQRGTTGKRANAGKQLSSSFVDPYEISIDMSSEFEDTDISDDPDFEPSFTMEAVIPQELEEQLEDVNLEDIECGLDLEDNMPDEEKFDDGGEMIRESVGCEWLVNETKVIVYVSQLKKLSSISISPCTTCGSIKINMEETYCGSAIHIKWVCEAGHICQRWSSQPLLNRRLNSGDFLINGAILTSGNNFGKMALWAKMLKLKFPSSNNFHRIQSNYIVPAIDQFWNEHQSRVIETSWPLWITIYISTDQTN